MQKLKSESHKLLTECVLKNLAQNRITTILEFLQEDFQKLSALTKWSLPQILEIRSDIFLKYSAPLFNGVTLMDNLSRNKYLSTGILSLDVALGGGVPVGYITELCGLADSGKTQLCLQLAINCVKNSKNTVLYVDTKGDFSAKRVQKILETSDYCHKDMAVMMHQIKVVYVWIMEDLIELLKKLKNKVVVIENLSLIIIDSLPCLMFQHLGDKNKIGLAYLNTMVNYSRYLCDIFHIAIVCVNIQTRWIDQDFPEFEDGGEECTSLLKATTCVEKRNRCLGKYWQHIPTTVVLFEKYPAKAQENSEENTQVLNIKVLKSNNLESGCNCTLMLDDLGIT